MLKILIERYPEFVNMTEELVLAVDLMEMTYINGGKILVCGNGGSSADCEHIVGELMKGFLLKRPLTNEEKSCFEKVTGISNDFTQKLQRAVPAISLPSQCAVLSAFINDVEPDMAYAQLTFGYGTYRDLLIGISTSGRSANVVNAVKTAKAVGMKTIGMTGEKESPLSNLCDCTLKAPSSETYRIQEYHLPMYHYMCAELEKRLFGEE